MNYIKIRRFKNMKVIYYGDKIEKNNKAISLCGPTPRSNKIISWRKEAIDILKNIGYDGILLLKQKKINYFGKENVTLIQM